VLRPSSREIHLIEDGHRHALHRLQPYQIARLGVGRTFQLNRVFQRMSALDNLLAVKFERTKAQALLEMVGLLRLKDHLAGQLSIGQQRLLEIARALMLELGRVLMVRPSVLLLDEPSAGLAPKVTDEIFDVLDRLNQEENLTLIIVEQNVHRILKFADYGYLLNQGQVELRGPCEELLNTTKLVEAYLSY